MLQFNYSLLLQLFHSPSISNLIFFIFITNNCLMSIYFQIVVYLYWYLVIWFEAKTTLHNPYFTKVTASFQEGNTSSPIYESVSPMDGSYVTIIHDVIGQSDISWCQLKSLHYGSPFITYSNLLTWESRP